MQYTSQPDLFTELTKQGIERSASNADAHVPDWQARAEAYLREFIRINEGNFMTEDIRTFAHAKGLPSPPSDRAWGSVILKASKNGLVVKVGLGYVKNAKAHNTPASVWRAV